jgi:hypothetical protein
VLKVLFTSPSRVLYIHEDGNIFHGRGKKNNLKLRFIR